MMLPECTSTGDALRELDGKSVITSDFILVNGDLVSNMKLDKVLEEHRYDNEERRIK
jgi:translation initiation factor eIF-2B subunit epsilon